MQTTNDQQSEEVFKEPYSFHLVSHFEECSLGVIVNSRIFFWECHGTFLVSYFNHGSFY
jgi:hypothetical protein